MGRSLVSKLPSANVSVSIPGTVYDNIVRSGLGGAPAVFLRRENGTIGVEGNNSAFLAPGPDDAKPNLYINPNAPPTIKSF
jgi:hypothetical protein